MYIKQYIIRIYIVLFFTKKSSKYATHSIQYSNSNRQLATGFLQANSYLKKNMESKLDLICNILASSNGKDKIIRLFCYSSYFIANWDLTPKSLQKSLILLSSELSKARTISRLFDDLPMLQYSIQCWRSPDQNLMVKINNILDQLYYPVEHLVSINFNFSFPLKTFYLTSVA